MFPKLKPALYGGSEAETIQALSALAETMITREFPKKFAETGKFDDPICTPEPEDENPTIPAGFTYLGQFIDHDLTFDPTSSLQKKNDVEVLEDFRTARFDLDSVYGKGPNDDPYLYDQEHPGLLLLQPGSDTRPKPGGQPVGASGPRPDIQRNSQGTAIIGDPRNDENLIVTQLQSLFIRFHNAVFIQLTNPGQSWSDRFNEAQKIVVEHYQWIVLHEFLPRIVGQSVTDAVYNHGKPDLRHYHHDPRARASYPFMPVEFSVAAYRFGHSMVRPSYSLNQIVIGATGGVDSDKFNRIPLFTADSPKTAPLANLNGFRPVPNFWGIDWSFFFDGLPKPASVNAPCSQTEGKPPLLPQPSYRIDTDLVDPLGLLQDALPPGVPKNSLALRNLIRSFRLGLPNGQSVARKMGIKVIPDNILWSKPDHQNVYGKFPGFKNNAPLWFYILKEAELTRRKGHEQDPDGGHHLGPVGGRIVAEVFIGLLLFDKSSILHQPGWKPNPKLAPSGRFDMASLIQFTT